MYNLAAAAQCEAGYRPCALVILTCACRRPEHTFDTTKLSEQWRASLLQATLRFTRADEVEAGCDFFPLSARGQHDFVLAPVVVPLVRHLWTAL
jgi:hypothetical protein